MKRLVFCFDGTWNKLDAPCPTNVVLTAESVLPLSPDNTAQLIFYDEGVGTDKSDKLSGGVFGAGLVKNLADGYRFLIFNYTPGDRIYIFGFSRGAYTARSFAGLLRTCGVLGRHKAARIGDAIELYKTRDDTPACAERLNVFRRDHSPEVCVSDEEDAWRRANVADYNTEAVRRLQIAYIGVWDTVGALGIPARYSWFGFANKKHQFHDTSLSSFVQSARHAVAIDERRLDFQPTLWTNIDALNAKAGKQTGDSDAPYRQVWFPGVHRAVGGGGERRGLSDAALDWVLDGARAAGLVMDSGAHSRVFELKPDYRDYLDNSEDPGLMYRMMNAVAAGDRDGPAALHEVGMSARRRWLEMPENLRDNKVYRPPTLDKAAAVLDALDPAKYGLGSGAGGGPGGGGAFDTYEVKRGDSLRAIAKALYGNPNDADRILAANLDKIDDADRIYPGQLLRIPRDAVAGGGNATGVGGGVVNDGGSVVIGG